MTATLRASPAGPLRGQAEIPGDKSCAHRALILASLAKGRSTIRGLPKSDDVMATRRAVEAFGATVEQAGADTWEVTGGAWRSPAQPIDCGNSGTTARLLMGAAAGFDLTATFTGDASLSGRPMLRVTAPLKRMGARFGGADRLPITVHGGQLGGIEHFNDPASAQVKSAILLAGLGTQAPVRVIEPVASRDHTELMLGEFGCDLDRAEGIIALGSRRALEGRTIAVAADPSSASFLWLAAAIVPGSEISTPGVLCNPLRTGFVSTLATMGARLKRANQRIQSGEIIADVTVGHAPLVAARVSPAQVPAMIDEIPAIAVACAFADGESVIEALGELRHKESDRLGAIVAGLTACGVMAAADGDTLRIFGRGEVRGGARIATQGDHRIAMAFLILGLTAREPVEVDRPEMIATSFPGFAETMRALGADIR